MTGCSCGNCELCAPGKPRVDPGNEVSKPKPHTLEWVMDFVRRHPGATTGQGEADLLVKEIDRLREELEAKSAYGMAQWKEGYDTALEDVKHGAKRS